MHRFTQALAAPRARRVLACAVFLGAALAQSAQAATQTRSVAGFDAVVLVLPAEVRIEQGARETLSLEAEAAVLPKITTEVHGRRLVIGVAPPGRLETREPIRIRLGVRALRAFESRAPGAIAIGPLRSESLSLVLGGGGSVQLERLEASSLRLRITGAGEVDVGGGRVGAQELAITGTGRYTAPGLDSERAEVSIDGSGEVQLAASSTLAVRIAGVGNVRFRGNPAVTRAISGIGTIEKD